MQPGQVSRHCGLERREKRVVHDPFDVINWLSRKGHAYRKAPLPIAREARYLTVFRGSVRARQACGAVLLIDAYHHFLQIITIFELSGPPRNPP